MQAGIWWLCHAAALLWIVLFPLHARSFTLNKKDQYIHCFCLLAGLILPIIVVLTIIIDSAVQYNSNELYKNTNVSFTSTGMGFGKELTNECSFGTTKVALYSIFIPMSIMLAMTASLIILVCFYIYKVSFY